MNSGLGLSMGKKPATTYICKPYLLEKRSTQLAMKEKKIRKNIVKV
jgi:hypothetical protein